MRYFAQGYEPLSGLVNSMEASNVKDAPKSVEAGGVV